MAVIPDPRQIRRGWCEHWDQDDPPAGRAHPHPRTNRGWPPGGSTATPRRWGLGEQVPSAPWRTWPVLRVPAGTLEPRPGYQARRRRRMGATSGARCPPGCDISAGSPTSLRALGGSGAPPGPGLVPSQVAPDPGRRRPQRAGLSTGTEAEVPRRAP